jgi:hypothetical protein
MWQNHAWQGRIVCAAIFVLSIAACSAQGADASSTAASAAGTNPVVIPFQMRRGHIMVSARVNGSEPQWFMLDTGYGVTMLRPGQPDALGLRRVGRVTIIGIAGEEEAGTFDGPTFDFSGATWKPRRVAAFPGTSSGRSRRREGILGSGFFRRFVVEIDPRARTVKLHEPASYDYSGPGEVLSLTFKSTTPVVEAAVVRPGQEPIQARFEIDIGCDGSLCVGSDFARTHQLHTTGAEADGSRRGVGGGARTLSGRLPQLRLGRLSIDKPAADFFLDGSPVDAPLAGHIGLGLLRDFKVIFDYGRRRMILEEQPDLPEKRRL